MKQGVSGSGHRTPPPDHARRRLEAEEKQVDEAGELQRKADPFEADRHAFLFPADSDA